MILKGLKWYNSLQFIVLCAAMVAVAVDWRWGLWMSQALGVVTLVKVVAERRMGNPSLDTPLRLALLGVVVYWLCHVVGLFFSQDMAGALEVVTRKAVLLIAPMCVLLSDMSYLRRDHLRMLFYLLLAAIVGVFVYDWITHAFEKKHHSYVAIYVLTAAAFVYRELTLCRASMPLWQRLMLWVAAAVTVVFIVYLNSRAGILGLYGVEVLCGLHFAVKRKWWQGALLAVLLVGMSYTAEKTLPNHKTRLAIVETGVQSVKNAVRGSDEGEEATEEEAKAPAKSNDIQNDARIGINVTALKCIAERPLLGYGVGDYDTVLADRFVAEGHEGFATLPFNAHNQYTETMLALGVPGLLVMLVWLLMPLWLAWRRKRGFWEVLVLTFIVMFSLLFESMLERQMGLLFVALLYAIMIVIINLSAPSPCRGSEPTSEGRQA